MSSTTNLAISSMARRSETTQVVEFLTQREQQICPDDIVDVFRGGKTAKIKQKGWDTLPIYPTEKRKILKTKELIQLHWRI
ncbi:19972_t:CDS:2 [Funneliformis geosporum]|uniref:19972_t:CDS:1 n=1 Tax=Funneliformis geosporum TaxID=1117311 RepID=A0A9W4SP75_9GLOM|nr:19972_t:CDS:2 [Funneliformis geosporum]